jgi:hypothetical protein
LPPSLIAADDVYASGLLGTEVGAPGVLANDLPAGVTAVMVDGSSAGSVTLNADGSFTFVAPLVFVDDVTFTYRVTDGVRFSEPAVVTLQPPLP